MSPVSTLYISAIRAYQAVAPQHVRDRCRFTPTCSEYAIEAIQKHGAWKGLRLTIDRLRRCKPPNGGDDHP